MSKHTISSLADIGSAAAMKHVPHTGMVSLDKGCVFYTDDAPAREAFVRAVVCALRKSKKKTA